ncbi:hypothetical protein LOK49_LG10G02579 [Camellia lanceoleosa]|uniref:Uncharacterized protein n=1 Tax=Camellia lanceoleosa TaxID=1840588 RepID=A0ACC0GAM3_9ERIC|nr:hypothetical protein LOK49_LG10G02579 [Camellia lanceoleosa]
MKTLPSCLFLRWSTISMVLEMSNEELELYVALQVVMQELYTLCVVAYIAIEIVLKRYIHKYPHIVIRGPNRLQEQMDHINRLVRERDITCIEQLRMDRRCFMTLCHMDNGLMLIVEPEILLDGEHPIERTLEVAERVWAEVLY